MRREPLPIDALLPDVVRELRAGPSLVVRAATGAGKTTRLPPALFDAGLAGAGRVVIVQPRRLAARAAAARIAEERGETVGQSIGYQVRFDRCVGPATRLLAVTDGVFLGWLQDDPLLETIGAVVFDEFHERTLAIDLALAMTRHVQREVRPDLRIVVMSATLAATEVAAWLGGCAVLVSEGRAYPIDVRYTPHERQEPLAAAVSRAAERLWNETSGDLLVFLPGRAEIQQAHTTLAGWVEGRGGRLVELYGDLPLDRQRAALLPGDRRRIVLATNVAETSVTVEGVTAVIDSGLARVRRMAPDVGLDRLRLERISRASAEQRAGRAGRTAPGICIRLWSERDHLARAAQPTPEVERVDVASAVLALAAWGERDVAGFGWFEAPPAAAVAAARKLLQRLQALDEAGVPTPCGRAMARLPLHPRLARLMLEGRRLGHTTRAAAAAALLSERDLLAAAGPARADRALADVDVLSQVDLVERARPRGGLGASGRTLESERLAHVIATRDQLARQTDQLAGVRPLVQSPPAAGHDADVALARALLAAFPDRLARRSSSDRSRGVMVGGRGLRLPSPTALGEAELFVAIDLAESGPEEPRVRRACPVRREWLTPSRLNTIIDVEFDAGTERVVGWRRTRWEDLVLDSVPLPAPLEESAELLALEAATRLTPWELLDDEGRSFVTRVASLAAWMPELRLPVLDEAALRELLPEMCRGCRSFADLRAARWGDALRARLPRAEREQVERQAPAHLVLPSGRRVNLVYEPGRPPYLAARIQEFFGLAATPRIAAGRVAVVLQLLAPNDRPQQVTDDLAGFWTRTYPQVRRELHRRYPRHAWPEDPLSARPQSRPGPRRPAKT